ncbi:MAG: four helix bundle protein [Pseudomonadota bacterium]
MELVEAVYALTERFPKKEEYRLTSQIIRAAISIPVNIAEGFRRNTRKDYAKFVSIAHGSTAEVETFLLVAERVNYAESNEISKLMKIADETSRMLRSLRERLLS